VFDLHVHTAPDLEERFGDDVEIVRLYEHAGSSGCVLKGHYDATAGRARAAGRGSPVRVYGALALNQHVGGLNPAAVAAALAMGARVIWMPTTDCHTQETAGLPRDVRHRRGGTDRPGRVRRDHRVSAPAPTRLLSVPAGRLRPRLSGPTASCSPPAPDSPPPPEAQSELLEALVREGLDRGAPTTDAAPRGFVGCGRARTTSGSCDNCCSPA